MQNYNPTIQSMIIDYFAGATTSEAIAEALGLDSQTTSDLLSSAYREWELVEVDPEGATPAQDRRLNAILEGAEADFRIELSSRKAGQRIH